MALSFVLPPIWFQIVESIRYDKFHDELIDPSPSYDINRPLSKFFALGPGLGLTGMKRLEKN